MDQSALRLQVSASLDWVFSPLDHEASKLVQDAASQSGVCQGTYDCNRLDFHPSALVRRKKRKTADALRRKHPTDSAVFDFSTSGVIWNRHQLLWRSASS